jgi:integrase
MVSALRAVYRAARKIRRDLPPPPTDAVAANEETRRKRALDARGLAAWWAQLQALANPVRREFHWLLLLTGGRPDALARAEWPQLDLRRRAWHFPDPKGGESRAFDLPLSREIVAALRRVRRAGRELYPDHARRFVFPGDAGRIVDTTEPRDRLSHWGGDLRRTFKTLGLECGLTELDTMMLQNHALTGASRGYIVTPALWRHLSAQQAKLSRHIARAAHRRR